MRLFEVDRSRLKLALAIVLFLSLAALVGSVLGLSGKALFLVERGGTAAPIENVIVDIEADDPGRLVWLEDAPALTRQLDAGTRARLGDSYLRAWRQLEIAMATCSTSGLTTYFAPGPAVQLAALVADAAESGCRTRRTDGPHRLRATFVSEDGGLVALTDDEHWYVDRVPGPAGSARFHESIATHDLVLRLDDGDWRIAAWRQTSRADRAPTTKRARPPAGFVASVGDTLSVDGTPWRPDGVNYYPAATPWREFWAEYDGRTIDTDMARATDLGFDALRIFVPFSAGPERPSDDVLTKLDDFLARARVNGLRVIVTLFDLDVDYRTGAWVAADQYLERLLDRFRDDPTILAWDLKNEADLDDRRVGRPLVDAWLRHVIGTARVLDPNHLLTIGWSDTTWASRLADHLDVVSVHDYRDPAGLPERLAAASAAAPRHPVLLTEYGSSSWQSPLVIGGRGEDGQAHDIAVARAGTEGEAAPLGGRFLWALSDFSLGAPGPDGVSAWRRGVQRSFGVLTADGTLKPAAAALRGRPVHDEPVLPSPFLLAVLLATIIGALRAAHRLRKGSSGPIGAVLLVLLHPLSYAALGVGLTVLAEAMRMPPTWLPLLAVVGILAASLLAGLLTRISASAARNLRRLVSSGPRQAPPRRTDSDTMAHAKE